MQKKEPKEKKEELLAKVLILGDSAVGKTNVLLRFCNDSYKPNYLATMGVDFRAKTVEVKGRVMKLMIWDTAGQDRFRTITQSYYNKASGVVLIYAFDDRRSFENVSHWIKQIAQHTQEGLPLILAANKADIPEEERMVTSSEGVKLAGQLGVPYFQTSAKTGTGVQKLFNCLAEKLVDRNAPEDKASKVTFFGKKELGKNCCN